VWEELGWEAFSQVAQGIYCVSTKYSENNLSKEGNYMGCHKKEKSILVVLL